MTTIVTAFEHAPDGGKGLGRDMRVRWALEEVGQPYEVRPVSLADLTSTPYLTQHPFGQIPVLQDGDLTLFESGSIVMHIGLHRSGLLSQRAKERALAITWMFAALNTVEPPILELENARQLEGDKPWAAERLPLVQARVRDRLEQLSTRLGKGDWLEASFSAGDLLMVSVLQRLKASGMLTAWPNLVAYVARGEARPAYLRAQSAQWALDTEAEARAKINQQQTAGFVRPSL